MNALKKVVMEVEKRCNTKSFDLRYNQADWSTYLGRSIEDGAMERRVSGRGREGTANIFFKIFIRVDQRIFSVFPRA